MKWLLRYVDLLSYFYYIVLKKSYYKIKNDNFIITLKRKWDLNPWNKNSSDFKSDALNHSAISPFFI